MQEMRREAQLSAVLLVTFLVFLPEIHYSLVYDDLHLILGNTRLTAWSYVPGYFTTHLYANVPSHDLANFYYRPISLLWFRLVYAIFGAPAPIWHVSSILAHLVTTGCLFLLIHRLVKDFQGAAIAAAIFAIHPIQTETVAWLSASGDLLLTSFLVLSVYFYAGRKSPISLLSILFAALAMFTKEVGIVAPALICAYEWTQSRFKTAIISAVPYALPALFYLAFRSNALGNLVTAADPKMSRGAMVLTWPRLLAAYARHLVWPVHLSPSYATPIETAWWPLLLLIAVIAILVWLVRGGCANVRFGAIWFAITLAPALAIRYMTLDDYVHDRYLYLPSVGLAIIAAVYLSRIRFTLPRSIAAFALVLAMCWGTRLNLRIWQDEISLFNRAVEMVPENMSIKNNLAAAYLIAHRDAEAYPLLKELLERYPNAFVTNQNMGVYYRHIGNPEAAKYYFSNANLAQMR